MMKSIYFIAFFVVLTAFCSAQQTSPSLRQIQVDVVYLASNLLQGRETGKAGEQMAADYIVSRFTEIGLKPLPGNQAQWYQPFEFDYNENPHATEGGEHRTGHNVIGFIDNGAPTTVVIGAHYDHLGMGMPMASLYTGDPAIHNGADDNASGVAAMLLLAEKLVQSPAKNNNYLFIGFSGEELGLYGSKYFTNHPPIDLSSINYMLNMDMVGRLNEERTLAVYGVGTSPVWKEELETINNGRFKIKTTESGIGPSDHTSFYLKNIPVLHFFTGQHKDYHKPTDDSEHINYSGINEIAGFMYALIEKMDAKGKLAFTKTKDEQKQGASFKVTLGVMPDYVYDGEGMRIDAVMDDRPAKSAGIQGGDIIVKIGDVEVKTIYDYMEGLSKFKKGDSTEVKVKRGKKILKKKVTF
ncbi:MAG TPA: M28 family peptidase [Bacteroidetes bacterium]|nr:M28 family peptidase [Bacteroidota bacterium]